MEETAEDDAAEEGLAEDDAAEEGFAEDEAAEEEELGQDDAAEDGLVDGAESDGMMASSENSPQATKVERREDGDIADMSMPPPSCEGTKRSREAWAIAHTTEEAVPSSAPSAKTARTATGPDRKNQDFPAPSVPWAFGTEATRIRITSLSEAVHCASVAEGGNEGSLSMQVAVAIERVRALAQSVRAVSSANRAHM